MHISFISLIKMTFLISKLALFYHIELAHLYYRYTPILKKLKVFNMAVLAVHFLVSRFLSMGLLQHMLLLDSVDPGPSRTF